jgi:CheY-like chemotaxis protein/HPt (histidine-containing phosphotransfer) domain-containing protein
MLLGGNVQLEFTQPGVGSRFVLEIPLCPVEGTPLVADLDACSEGVPERVVGGTVALATLRGRILLAEDGEENQRLIAFYLRKAGALVTIAANGRLALDALNDADRDGHPFDLLLTDMQMPEMDGYTLARTLREQGSRLPIIALTAHAMAEDKLKCMAAGCDDYATKPIDKRALLAICAGWLGGAHEPVPTLPVLYSDYADHPDLGELVPHFLHHLGDRIVEIETHRGADQGKALATVGHQLKGAAGSYGYPLIGEAARAVEMCATDMSDEAVRDAAIELLLERCRAAVRGGLVATR